MMRRPVSKRELLKRLLYRFLDMYSSSPSKGETAKEKIGLRGEVFIELYDKEGKLKDYRHIKNLIPSKAIDTICDTLGSTYNIEWNRIAIGGGTTAPASTDTALENEYARKISTYSHTTGSNYWEHTVTFLAGEGTGAITETGMFDLDAGGTLLARQTFGVVNKGANDELKITWKFTLSV